MACAASPDTESVPDANGAGIVAIDISDGRLVLGTSKKTAAYDCTTPTLPAPIALPAAISAIGGVGVVFASDGRRMVIDGRRPEDWDQTWRYLVNSTNLTSASVLHEVQISGSVSAVGISDVAWAGTEFIYTLVGRYGRTSLQSMPTVGDELHAVTSYSGGFSPLRNAEIQGTIATAERICYCAFTDALAAIDLDSLGRGAARSVQQAVYTSCLKPSDYNTRIMDLERRGDRLYGAMGSTGLIVYSISNRLFPEMLGLYPLFSTTVAPPEDAGLRLTRDGSVIANGASKLCVMACC